MKTEEAAFQDRFTLTGIFSCARDPLRGASHRILQVFTAPLAAAVEGGAAVAGIRSSLPASFAESSGGGEARQIRILGETSAIPEEPERELPVPQHLRSSSGRR